MLPSEAVIPFSTSVKVAVCTLPAGELATDELGAPGRVLITAPPAATTPSATTPASPRVRSWCRRERCARRSISAWSSWKGGVATRC